LAWDDPVVWILLVGAVILLFGSNKIPELARSLGAARKEFDSAKRGLVGAINSEINNAQGENKISPGMNQSVVAKAPPINTSMPEDDDPLLVAARNEGIDTRGKSRSEIASELASKVKD
jgi:TatA/E family protein of Tat protein translocase